jgi:ABC-2 type transport system ATP-binding protein/Cu-processing system ATP-binding protein
LPIVEISCLTKTYGKKDVVKNVSLNIERGEIFALLGHNGAGKTTLIKMLVGLLQASAGCMKINGQEVAPLQKEVKKQFSYMPETMALFPHLSASETLRFFARLQKLPDSRVDELLKLVELSELGKQKVGSFSKGMTQRLGLAIALLPDSPLLILDEPTSGLDPLWVIKSKKIINQLNESGKTIIFTSHILSEVEELVDRVGIMREGDLIALGSVKELKRGGANKVRVKAFFEPEVSADELKARLDYPITSEKGWQVVSCSYENKLEVIDKISSFEQLGDMEILEITLEDIYHSIYQQKGGCDHEH